MTVLLTLLLALWPVEARAETPVERAQQAELERVRAKVANEVQLHAYDLVDELIYGWTLDPVFESPTPVVLAGVTVPVGLGTGMQALVENHVAAVLLANPRANVALSHCPTCTQIIVQSGPEATVLTRGIDSPEVLARLGTTSGKVALFLDIEAEGSFLVLRARLTRLDPELPIVWSRTLSTSTSTPALLRDATALKSVEEARAEYLAALEDRGPLFFISRFGVRMYKRPRGPVGDLPGQAGTPPPPFLWLQLGAEYAPTDAMDWMASLVVGGSFIPDAYQGLMLEARIDRLITGRARHHTRPDLYLYLGSTVTTVWGPATAPFTVEPIHADAILRASEGSGPRFIFGTILIGTELRVGNRIGLSGFLETLPSLRQSPNMSDHVRVLGIGFQSLGTEVTLSF
jgi:hypothetical protein